MSAADRRPATALNDMELAELAGVGDRTALGELARRYGPGVQILLRRAGAEPGVADSIARRAFLTAFERMTEFRGEGAFAGWIHRLAVRHYLGGRAAPGRRGDFTPPRAGEAGAGKLAPSRDIAAALADLPPRERLCICACYGAGLTVVEVAAALDSTAEAVRSSLQLGLEALRSSLDPSPDDAAPGFDVERRLQRALMEPEAAGDGALFARDVERRLARVWIARRLTIALAGAGSALIALWSLAASSLATRLEATIRSPFALLERRLGVLHYPWLRLLPFSTEALWMVAGLVLLAAGLLAARLFDDP